MFARTAIIGHYAMPWRSFALLLVALAMPAASRAGPPEQASSAATIFASYCLGGLPNFSTLDNRAAAAGLVVFLDRTVPMGADRSIRQKHWLVPDAGSRMLLTAEEAVNGPLHVVGCGVFATDADGKDIERALSADARLGSPVQRHESDAGRGTTVSWRPHLGPASPSAELEVLLAYDVPDLQGVSVNLIYRTRAKP